MNVKKHTLLFSAIICILTQTSMAWGGKGHDIIANIAYTHLNTKARKAVKKNLEGRSMIYYSLWLDKTRGDSTYKHTYTWHYANIDEGKTYETMVKQPEGDIYTATTMVIEKLNDKTINDSLRCFYLKCLIHLIGDLHCPMHCGRATDRGGNDFEIKWFNRPTNLHRFWDTQIVESLCTWSYTEWGLNIDILSEQQQTEIEKGTIYEWFTQTAQIANDIYKNTTENKNYSYDYMENYATIVETQFLRAGYRLAYILNHINW